MTGIMKGIILLFLPIVLSIGVHKFYVSVTNVEYYKPEKAIQITSRVFIDDLEKALEERYGVNTFLGTPEEKEDADSYIEKYLKARFVVRINGNATEYNYLGKKFDNDILILFIEILNTPLDRLSSLEIQNEILMDVFEEQKNIIHFKLGDKKRSFVLVRESSRGMLNF